VRTFKRNAKKANTVPPPTANYYFFGLWRLRGKYFFPITYYYNPGYKNFKRRGKMSVFFINVLCFVRFGLVDLENCEALHHRTLKNVSDGQRAVASPSVPLDRMDFFIFPLSAAFLP